MTDQVDADRIVSVGFDAQPSGVGWGVWCPETAEAVNLGYFGLEIGSDVVSTITAEISEIARWLRWVGATVRFISVEQPYAQQNGNTAMAMARTAAFVEMAAHAQWGPWEQTGCRIEHLHPATLRAVLGLPSNAQKDDVEQHVRDLGFEVDGVPAHRGRDDAADGAAHAVAVTMIDDYRAAQEREEARTRLRVLTRAGAVWPRSAVNALLSTSR